MAKLDTIGRKPMLGDCGWLRGPPQCARWALGDSSARSLIAIGTLCSSVPAGSAAGTLRSFLPTTGDSEHLDIHVSGAARLYNDVFMLYTHQRYCFSKGNTREYKGIQGNTRTAGNFGWPRFCLLLCANNTCVRASRAAMLCINILYFISYYIISCISGPWSVWGLPSKFDCRSGPRAPPSNSGPPLALRERPSKFTGRPGP